jgi:hypothetical protein
LDKEYDMEHIDALLTRLALDPFASLQIRQANDGKLVRERLRTAITCADVASVAGADWSACDTCSDPGTDDHDPFRNQDTD